MCQRTYSLIGQGSILQGFLRGSLWLCLDLLGALVLHKAAIHADNLDFVYCNLRIIVHQSCCPECGIWEHECPNLSQRVPIYYHRNIGKAVLEYALKKSLGKHNILLVLVPPALKRPPKLTYPSFAFHFSIRTCYQSHVSWSYDLPFVHCSRLLDIKDKIHLLKPAF